VNHSLWSWRKSSRSTTNGECIEVAWPGPQVAVRDSKNPAGGYLAIAPSAFSVFLESVRT
jgi:hypothetical protein